MRFLYSFFFFMMVTCLTSQADRWQQHIDYQMKIDFDVETHQFEGVQKIEYTNNSPDTLRSVYYHLYFNAFQPNSMMDVRSRTILDPSRKIGDRISKLSPEQYGYHRVTELKQDGKKVTYHTEGTILEVQLAQAIPPGGKTMLEMKFNSQVPIQIRRSGRDNAEGIDYSMAQWYPKLCEYDYQGWHANPYIGREFHGVWGNFEVEIEIDDSYILGGSGVLTNADKIGRGYSDTEHKIKGKKICWKFKAENVHDFAWAADRDYTVKKKLTDQGTALYYIYQPGERTTENWENLHRAMNASEKYMNERFGEYPYPVYSFIQGGDGGMEYPMATLITGVRSYGSLVGVSIHEWMHSWFQMVLGTNESLYAWMDEGFTTFGSSEVLDHLRELKLLGGDRAELHPNEGNVKGYVNFTKTGYEEPLSTHADHFVTNGAYSRAAYTKGAVVLAQMQYLLGEERFSQAMLNYYNTWKFKHPNANDFFRIMEKEGNIELDWFKEYFVNTTHTIDYAVVDAQASESNSANTTISLAKIGVMPMPVDLTITLTDNTKIYYTIPLRMMRGEKQMDGNRKFIVAKDWPWTNGSYNLEIPYNIDQVSLIEIDDTRRLADVNIENNNWSN